MNFNTVFALRFGTTIGRRGNEMGVNIPLETIGNMGREIVRTLNGRTVKPGVSSAVTDRSAAVVYLFSDRNVSAFEFTKLFVSRRRRRLLR